MHLRLHVLLDSDEILLQVLVSRLDVISLFRDLAHLLLFLREVQLKLLHFFLELTIPIFDLEQLQLSFFQLFHALLKHVLLLGNALIHQIVHFLSHLLESVHGSLGLQSILLSRLGLHLQVFLGDLEVLRGYPVLLVELAQSQLRLVEQLLRQLQLFLQVLRRLLVVRDLTLLVFYLELELSSLLFELFFHFDSQLAQLYL